MCFAIATQFLDGDELFRLPDVCSCLTAHGSRVPCLLHKRLGPVNTQAIDVAAKG